MGAEDFISPGLAGFYATMEPIAYTIAARRVRLDHDHAWLAEVE